MLDGRGQETIDWAAGTASVGPIELADQVGLDICLAVADMLKKELNWPMPDAPQWLRDKVAEKKLGRKTGEGLYVWKDGQPVKAQGAPAPEPEMADRLVLPMVNVCVTLLRQKISTDADVIDGAMIFGAGFAPFRGGPAPPASGAWRIRKALTTCTGATATGSRPTGLGRPG